MSAPLSVSDPADSDTAVDRLVQQIRAFVRTNALTVGDVLPTERELGERFGAGRNTVREAIRIMRAYGIVEVRPKIGAVLADRHEAAAQALFSFQQDISPASFLDVQGYRKIIEVGIGDILIGQASDADFDRLEAINARIDPASPVVESAAGDFAFHEALVTLAGNRTMLANYRLLRPVITRIMQLGKEARGIVDTARDSHGEIIAALRARDRLAYAYLMTRHLEFGLRFVAPPDGA